MKDSQINADLAVVVLISGRGSNFESLVKHASHYRVVGVISNNKEAKGLSIAQKLSIPFTIIERENFHSARAYREAIGDAAENFGITSDSIKPDSIKPDTIKLETIKPETIKPETSGLGSSGLIALAGFMEILKEPFLSRFSNKIINIHPSLLPSYPGLDTHSRIIADNKLLLKHHDAEYTVYHGCTVHLLDAGVDTGSIIAQCKCIVSKDDTPESLAQKVLKIEHRLYPWVIKQIAKGNITISSAYISISPEAYADGKNEGFLLPNN